MDRQILARILSYYQVMPSFLDLVFSFGKQLRLRDYHLRIFRSEPYRADHTPVLSLPERRRSGRTLQLCYSLRSAEKISTHSRWQPWSICECVVYHSYDLDSELATWIAIKGTQVIQERINASINSKEMYGDTSGRTESSYLGTTLKTHLLIAAWSAEQWRGYTDFLETQFQQYPSNDLPAMINQLQALRSVENQRRQALLVLQADQIVLERLKQFYSIVLTEIEKEGGAELRGGPEIETFCEEMPRRSEDLAVHQRRLQDLRSLFEKRQRKVSRLPSFLAWWIQGTC